MFNNLSAQTTLMGAILHWDMKVGGWLFMSNADWGIKRCVSNEREVRERFRLGLAHYESV